MAGELMRHGSLPNRIICVNLRYLRASLFLVTSKQTPGEMQGFFLKKVLIAHAVSHGSLFKGSPQITQIDADRL